MNYGLSPSFNRVVDSIYKNVKINPYTNKVSQKMSGPTKKFIESSISGNVNNMPRKMDEESVMKLKSELMGLNIPIENIDDQLKELTRKRNQKGALSFDLDGSIGNAFRKSNTAILVAPTASGKTVCILGSLIFEISNPFDTIIYFSGKSSYENEHVQTFKAICKRVVSNNSKDSEPLMHFLWFNTDNNKQPINFFKGDWNQYKQSEINKDGSIKSLYASPYGSVFIFDDLQNAGIHDPVYELMSDLAIKGRHRLINWFITFQTAVRLNTKLLTNCERLFISKLAITDKNVWTRLKKGEPTNLKECMQDPDPPRFYYLDNNKLLPYLNLEFSDLKQVINKLKSKLPAPILDEEKKKQYMQASKIIEQYEKQHEVAEPVKEEKKEPVKVKEENVPAYDHIKKTDILNNIGDLYNRRRRGVRLFS